MAMLATHWRSKRHLARAQKIETEQMLTKDGPTTIESQSNLDSLRQDASMGSENESEAEANLVNKTVPEPNVFMDTEDNDSIPSFGRRSVLSGDTVSEQVC
ncbi:hypothetical protein BGX28_004446, partial [Mortierella sp. GBA30]